MDYMQLQVPLHENDLWHGCEMYEKLANQRPNPLPLVSTSSIRSTSHDMKYNVMYHLAELHANLGSDETMPKIPGKLLVEAFITSEEDLMGIDDEITERWRAENDIPDTDGVGAI